MRTQTKPTIFVTMLAFLIMLPVARASEQDQAIKLTFDKAVQIPGHVLPAGTYWFTVLETNANPKVVRISNSDRSTVYATVATINTERSIPTDGTAITFADRGSMQPETIVNWFYPGDTSGHEFVYSDAAGKQLAQVKRHTVVAAARGKQQKSAISNGD
jgi:hypothetical protein